MKQQITQKDVTYFKGKTLFSLTFGIMTTTLQFEEYSIQSNTNVLFVNKNNSVACDIKTPESLKGLFCLLNDKVISADLLSDYTTSLTFSNRDTIKIFSDNSGYESYTIQHHEIVPVW